MVNGLSWMIKNLHLLISIGIVLPTGIIYGSPSILTGQLDIQVGTTDIKNLLRAIMCLYIGISFVWVLGVWNSSYWKRATELNILFMLTLAIGRGLSMLFDGQPTEGYVFAIVAELVLGFYSIYQLRKYSSKIKSK